MLSAKPILETNEFEDVIHSLIIVKDAVQKTQNAPLFWKVAIIHTHAALQGSCVCLLTRTDGTGAMTQKVEKDMWEKYYGVTEGVSNLDRPEIRYPTPRVADLGDLLKRLPKDIRPSIPSEVPRKKPWNAETDLRLLINLRNEFMHFPPQGWTIEVSGMPRVLRHAIELAKKAAFHQGYSRTNRFNELDGERHFDDCLNVLRDAELENTGHSAAKG
ncbi:MAG: hypothetical protein AAGI10_05870 [Pseudomonadota bacterium]